MDREGHGVGAIRDRWGHWTELASGAAVVLDRPLQLILDRAWVGGAAPRFEQDLAGQRQALQTAWQHVLEAMAAQDAAEQRLAEQRQPGQPQLAGIFAPAGTTGPATSSPLGVPPVATTVTATASCYPAGAFTGVDLDGFADLARRLTAAGPALLDAIEQLPTSALSGITLGFRDTAADLARIQQIAGWARSQGSDLAARLDLIRRADAAAVTGLTAPNGVSGPLLSAAMAGTVLFAPSPPDATQTALQALVHGDATALPALLHAQRAGYDPFLATQITLAWKTLTPDQHKTLITTDPAGLGNLDGIPAATRDQANRAVLATELIRLTADLDQKTAHRTQLAATGASTRTLDQEISRIDDILTGMTAIKDRMDSTPGVPVLLLGLDTARHGHAIVSFGNPDTATDTITFVPGLATTLAGAQEDTDRALVTYRQASKLIPQNAPGHTVASVYWLGYDPPQTDLTTLIPDRSVLGTGPADEGAPQLASYTSGLRATHDPTVPDHLTVLGHSYGSLTTGTAATLTKGVLADDLIFVGSPGVGTNHATDLGLPGSHVFAGAAANDPVTLLPSRKLLPVAKADHDLGIALAVGNVATNIAGITDNGAFGTDPSRTGFGGIPFHVAPGGLDAHSRYWDTDTSKGGTDESLTNISLIAIGRPDLITPAR